MAAQQHVSCASNGNQHHAGNADRLVMNAALKSDAGAKYASGHEPHQDVPNFRRHLSRSKARSEEHTSELQSHQDLHSFPTRRSSDLIELGSGSARWRPSSM